MDRAQDMPDPAAAQSLQEWRRLAAKALQGGDVASLQSRTRDGIVVEPLYAGRRDVPPLPGRGAAPWTIVQVVDDPDPERANRQALDDLRGGATGLALRFAGSPAAAGAGLPATEEALRFVLQDIDLATIHLRLDPHPGAPAIAGWLRDLVARRGIAPERADIRFGLDPVAMAAARGFSAANGVAELVACFVGLSRASFRGPLATLDARLVHDAGATEGQELAAIVAGAGWWLKALDRAGVDPGAALPRFEASLAAERNQLLTMAKFRAVRLLWARLQELCGVPPARLFVHAETSRRMMTRADPHANLLRAAIAAFAAAAGGADSVAVLPHTAALGTADAAARALARDMQHIMINEAQLHRVADPAAGSGAVEALTEALAERAWTEFQAIEREGGILASLASGAFFTRITEAREALRRDLASGAEVLVGATVYRNPDDRPLSGKPDGALAAPAAVGLAPVRLETLADTA